MITHKAKLNIKPKEASELLRITNNFAEMLEDVLESAGRYSNEFLSGLRLSIRQAKNGNLKKVSSLKEI